MSGRNFSTRWGHHLPMSPEQFPAFMLTKTNFRLFLECKREFWLHHHHPEAIVMPPDANSRFRFHQGKEVHRVARGNSHFVDASRQGMLRYEVDIRTGSLQARLDAISRNDQALTAYEIKSKKHVPHEEKAKSKRDKREAMLYDLGFQVFVARRSGLDINRAVLVTINGDYLRGAQLDPDGLLHFEDVSEEIESVQKEIGILAADALRLIASGPSDNYEDLCGKKLTCPYFVFSQPDLPNVTIFDIPNLRGQRLEKLKATGAIAIEDIPGDSELTEAQWNYVREVLNPAMEPRIRRSEIREMTDLEYPHYFLDYETVNPAVPQFVGMKPHENITFQYSLHIVAEPGAEPIPSGFLAEDGRGDFQKMLVESLRADIGDGGTVICWNKSFETGQNELLARLYPEHADFLYSLNERSFDLGKPFKENLYQHPGIKGWSLKSVQPVLAPEMPYDALEIDNGIEASARWFLDVYLDSKSKTETPEHLKKYCELDTLVMVRILDKLKAL